MTDSAPTPESLTSDGEGALEGAFRDPRLRAWVLLVVCLSACAGHGVFLLTAVTRFEAFPGIRQLGGKLALLVLFFIATVPMAAGALAFRRRLLAWEAGRLRLVSRLALVGTVLAFAAYVWIMRRA